MPGTDWIGLQRDIIGRANPGQAFVSMMQEEKDGLGAEVETLR